MSASWPASLSESVFARELAEAFVFVLVQLSLNVLGVARNERKAETRDFRHGRKPITKTQNTFTALTGFAIHTFN